MSQDPLVHKVTITFAFFFIIFHLRMQGINWYASFQWYLVSPFIPLDMKGETRRKK